MIIRLTDVQKRTPVLIGTKNVIQMFPFILTHYNGSKWDCTKIESVGAMVSTNYVAETVDEIWQMINKTK
jgi:hypothetical protein